MMSTQISSCLISPFVGFSLFNYLFTQKENEMYNRKETAPLSVWLESGKQPGVGSGVITRILTCKPDASFLPSQKPPEPFPFPPPRKQRGSVGQVPGFVNSHGPRFSEGSGVAVPVCSHSPLSRSASGPRHGEAERPLRVGLRALVLNF